jgi:hypothetical protein
VGTRTGPRIGEQAERIRRDIAGALAREPAPDEVGWYLSRARSHAAASRPVLAHAFAREARALGSRRTDRYGVAEADALLPGLQEPKAAQAP